MRRWLVWLLAIIGAITMAIAAASYWENGKDWVGRQRLRRSVDNAVRSTAYPILKDQWVSFQLPPQSVALSTLR